MMIHPVLVRYLPGDTNHFGIIAGAARVAAARASGAKTIECKVVKRCTDEMAEQISLRENIDRHLSKEDERRSRAALAKFLIGKEEAALASAPENGGKRPGGRPRSLESRAIKKAAALKGVSEKTIKRSMRPLMLAPIESTATDANGESSAAAPGETNEVKNVDKAGRGIVEEFGKFVRALDQFREKYLIPLLVRLPNASAEDLADVDTADVDHVMSFMAAMRKLRSLLPNESDSDGENEAKSDNEDETSA